MLFTTYRVIEKFFGIRMESFIGFYLFKLFAQLFKVEKIDFKESNKEDKRTIWGELRFDQLDGNLKGSPQIEIKKTIAKSIAIGLLAFENSMESSIRGINLITFYKKNDNIYKQNRLFSLSLLWVLKLHVLLCPDFYINYRNLPKDESNNHRFYNLLFLCYYNFFKDKKITLDRLNSFVSNRCVNSEFYDEGSSFYHFGVMHGLSQLYDIVNHFAGYEKLIFSTEVMSMIKNRWYFEDLKFGDRDGTLISFFHKRHRPKLQTKTFLNRKFYYEGNSNKYCFLRIENWTNFGTEGHIHDDSGMFLYSDGNISILDPGIRRYLDEPKFCLRSFHNFPVISFSQKHMKFKAKFERIPNKSVEFINEPFQLVVTNREDEFKLVRSLNKNTYGFVDSLEMNDRCISGTIDWVFYVSKSARISTDHTKLIIQNFAEFSYHENMLVEIQESLFYPEYQCDEECYRIKFQLELNGLSDIKKLLEFIPLIQSR